MEVEGLRGGARVEASFATASSADPSETELLIKVPVVVTAGATAKEVSEGK